MDLSVSHRDLLQEYRVCSTAHAVIAQQLLGRSLRQYLEAQGMTSFLNIDATESHPEQKCTVSTLN